MGWGYGVVRVVKTGKFWGSQTGEKRITVDSTSVADMLLEANARLIQTAFPDVEDMNTLNESEAIPRLAATAAQLCNAGDTGICNVMRSWLWDGILTMLVDAGFDLGMGGPDSEQSYAAFVLGDEAAVSPVSPYLAEILPFRPRSPE